MTTVTSWGLIVAALALLVLVAQERKRRRKRTDAARWMATHREAQ